MLQLQELQSTWWTQQSELRAQVNQLQLDAQTTNQQSEIKLNTEQVKFEASQAELGYCLKVLLRILYPSLLSCLLSCLLSQRLLSTDWSPYHASVSDNSLSL